MNTDGCRHQMPFGAEILADGAVHFRLWAPAAGRVDLCLVRDATDDPGGQIILPMAAGAQGWFDLRTGRARAGSRYRFRIDGDTQVPDPASRFQPEDVHGPSEVIAPGDWQWQDTNWHGRPWEEAILYELHVGSFAPGGSFAAVQLKLDHLAALGVTAIELMPVADFPGGRNWGYDGAYLFAPDSRYGRPEDLKALVDAAHARGLMAFLDVVYNHFGPEGNYLHVYAPQFFIHNALYWLEEYHFDGLRFDAVHAIMDHSDPDILTELAGRVHEYFGDTRRVHLVLENDHNAAHYLGRDRRARPRCYVAQWNDDVHHALHVALTGESSGYYMDYAGDPLRHLGRCLTEGFAYQGQRSAYRDDQPRGEPSDHLPPTAFVSFLQNHDQVGNRAFGERIASLIRPEQLHAALALLLLGPSPPLLFMGEEWACRQPFPFFCDFGPDLAAKVVAGRRQEFARFPQFSDPASLERIPDPMDPQTFGQAVLDWTACGRAENRGWLDRYRELLTLRHRELIPRLRGIGGRQGPCTRHAERALSARWLLGDGSTLTVLANLGDEPLSVSAPPRHCILYETHPGTGAPDCDGQVPAWSVTWSLYEAGSAI
jgi:maltooligosyltrehalose trehalohydrolase